MKILQKQSSKKLNENVLF